jgi:hypothetical protein
MHATLSSALLAATLLLSAAMPAAAWAGQADARVGLAYIDPTGGDPVGNPACTTETKTVAADDILGQLTGGIVSLVGKSVGDPGVLASQGASQAYLRALLGDSRPKPSPCSTLCLIVPYYSAVTYQACYVDSSGHGLECLGGDGNGRSFSIVGTSMSVGRGDARVVCSTGRNLSTDTDRTFYIHATW